MTDYFALLDQPRRPWLDPDELKQAFHSKSFQAHPDTQPQNSSSGAAFAELNEAYQVLQEPKRRIQHLLSLSDRGTSGRGSSVPQEIEALFPVVAALMHDAEALIQKSAAVSNPLSRSLLKPQILDVQDRLTATLRRLSDLHDDGVAELQRMGIVTTLSESDWSDLERLYLRFSYVSRWMEELQEKQLRLSSD